MTCECGHRMSCRFSVPVGRAVRYRFYRCECGGAEETVEYPVALMGRETEALRGLVSRGQQRRFKGAKMRKRGAA